MALSCRTPVSYTHLVPCSVVVSCPASPAFADELLSDDDPLPIAITANSKRHAATADILDILFISSFLLLVEIIFYNLSLIHI